MFRYLTRAARHAVGLHCPGFRLPVREDDILLASYPKSGDKRTRFLIASIVLPEEEIEYDNLHRFVLDGEVAFKRDFDRAPRPRIIHSHASFDPRYRRIIQVVRDPRDVALAQYYDLLQLHRIAAGSSIDEFMERFLCGDLNRFPGSWGENVGSWLAARAHHPGFLLLRYEDMLSDPAGEIARVSALAGQKTTGERILLVLERSSADNTRERAHRRRSWLTEGSRPEVGCGTAVPSGEWRTALPESCVARIEANWGNLMACLGYELVTGQPGHASGLGFIGRLTAAPQGPRKQEVTKAAVPDSPAPILRSNPSSGRGRVIKRAKRILGHTSPGRYLDVFDDDVFLVSFPKSGNTWTRFLIANLLHPEESANFSNIDRLIPESEELTRNELKRVPRPRIMKSHEYFDPRFRKVVYIVRDPRDVAVSQFHFYRKRRRIDDHYPIEQFVKLFVAGYTSDYGSWADNVATWLVARQNSSDFLLVKYEDLLAQTVSQLTHIASFLAVPTTPALVAQAVERSSADQMRKLESHKATASVTKNTRADIPFVRAASSGGWKKSLPESAVAELEAAWAPVMRWLGYEPLVVKLTTPELGRESIAHQS